MKPGPEATCQCAPCRRRREARQRWYETHRVAHIRANARYKRIRRRKKKAELSDAELDQKALESMPWRVQ